MGFFTRFVAKGQTGEHTLGNPLGLRTAATERRLNHFASMNPKGFRQPKKGPKTVNGMTRRERREERLAAWQLKRAEAGPRDSKYEHSHARHMTVLIKALGLDMEG